MEDSVCQVMVEGEVYQKTRKEEKLILYLKKIQIREMGNGKAVADERLLVYLDEKGNGPEIGQRILVKGNVGFFDPAANPGSLMEREGSGKTGEKDFLPGKAVAV